MSLKKTSMPAAAWPSRAWPGAASLGPRYLAYDKLGVAVFSVSEYEEAIASLKKGKIAKAVFKMN